ncbi:17.4 kDa class III heat shock protein [Diospyros lotus]|uniref:17.4 kDa class III heat shock protein n=1 Tax=Diospyros lotus TaxID=55363 RepID=UPI002253CBEB|nr:17.4 kDa class III heat shock protein [Diospyros lotus]
MSSVVDFDHLLNFPESVGKLVFPSGVNETENRGVYGIPVDIMDTPKEYIFYMDVPGLSKSEIQVTVEDNTLVIRSHGKRKREEDEEGCKYIRLERRAPQKLLRKFRLPNNANNSAISAKCKNGVLTVVVEKLPPPPKPKTVEVAIA